MLPRISDMPAPTPLHSDLVAELRLRGFEGDLAPVTATGSSQRPVIRSISFFPSSLLFPAALKIWCALRALLRTPASTISCSHLAAVERALTVSLLLRDWSWMSLVT